MKRLLYSLMFVIVLCVTLIGCGRNSSKTGDTGQLSLSVAQSSETKTLLPDISMDITHYDISGSGPDGNTFFISITDETQVTVSNIIPGNWSILVNAGNADSDVIGTGSASITVIAGATVSSTVIVRPVSGTGTLDLTLQWNPVDVQTPVIDAVLVPPEGEAQTLTFSISGDSTATFTNTSVPAGYYTLVVKLMDADTLKSGSVEIVRIVNNGTTAGNYQYTETDPAYGLLQVNITNEMGDPIDVTLAGCVDQINDDESMLITASVPVDTGNVTYVWYLDGITIGTGSDYTVRDLAPGYYRLDVTAYSATGTRAGSVSHDFTVINTGTVAVPAPVYDIPCSEGSGTTITDTVTGAVMTGIATTMNWCIDSIKDYTNRSYIKSGANFSSAGVFEGDLIDSSLSEYTVSFMTRITDDGQGAILHFLGSGLHFRFWNGGWDFAGGPATTSDYVKRNVWTRVTYVQSLTDRYIYINRALAAQETETGSLPAGSVRIGAYNTDSYFYPGEYTDITIYDTAFSQQQINSLCNSDGNDPEFGLLSDGSDMGSIYKREEHGGVYDTEISIENSMYRHWFNGDSCWGAIAKLIPPGYDSLWFSADFLYPANLTANHDFGTTAQTIGIYQDFGRSNPIAILYLNHDETTNVLTLGSVSYRNTANGAVTIALDGREIMKDQAYRFELHYNAGENGSVEFYLDGELLHAASADFDIAVQQAMYGLNLGIHPESPGDVIYSDNVYVGVKRISEYLQ